MVSRRVPFQAFKLTVEEQQHWQDRAYQLLDRTLRGYDERDGQGDGRPSIPRHHSELDSIHWKLLKTQDDASIYMEGNRSHQDPHLLGGNWVNPAVMLVVGTIRGDLDEIMLGVETPDFPSLKARSETFINQPVDGAFLTELLYPTEDDPFQFMGIQWTVYEHEWPLKAMVHPRDFVSLMWTGTMIRANGDHIGYEVVQPANLSQCPPLPKPFVRGKAMYATIFKQQEPGIVDVYVHSYVETQGFLMDKLVVNMTWRGMLGFWKTPELAEVKKLQWCMVHRRKQQQVAPLSSGDICSKCIEKQNLLQRRRTTSLNGRSIIRSGTISKMLLLGRHLRRSTNLLLPVQVATMSSLAERFERSLALGKNLPPLSDNAAKLEMYALFKQANLGKNATSRPGMLDFVGRAKWDAWNRLGDMNQDDAKLKYIAIIEDLAAKNGAAKQDEGAQNLEVAGSEDLLVEISEAGLLTIQMNRPSKFNAIDIAMYEGIMKAMESSKTQNNVKAVLLKSSGDYFSSGNDLSMFTSNPNGLSLEAMAEKGAVLLENVVNTFITYPKPVVAVVQGPAVGIAVTILALCDLVYLKETATLHTPFTSLGQSPEACSSLLFPRIMGSARANAMLLLGEKLSAKDAVDTGLATEVYGAAEFDSKVQSKLELLLSRYPQAIQRSKALIRSAETVKELQEVNRRECATLKELWLGPECMDAILKFQSRKH
ncbi:hypothetical protein BBO99_00004412 [Phytophthora kernoviae]|uniref:ACB domain-containing protein n=1 Tax=Phytophthora kernoviae TaxID=325452 RepID=A0A421FE44_9STRA|nr:hypothetical protein BBI17_004765 [Phytophthora kernoviae]RLN80545.1 hypothetical protein BBO99_00004412 [Phytophthora kernoviae]